MVVTKRKPKKQKRSPVKLNASEHARVRQLLCARMTCSATWAEVVIGAIDRGEVELFITDQGVLKADFAKVEKVLRRAGAYPPGGLLTLMRKCPTCGRWTPATAHQKGLDDQCEDCHINETPQHIWSQWPASPSAHAIQMAGILGVRIREGRM